MVLRLRRIAARVDDACDDKASLWISTGALVRTSAKRRLMLLHTDLCCLS